MSAIKRYKELLIAVIMGMALMTTLPLHAQERDVRNVHTSLYYSERARQLEDANAWESAKREIDEGLKYYPDDPDLLYLNGRYYYYAQRNLQKARYNLVKALQEDDQLYSAKRVLIDVEDDSKHYSSAICYINELLEQMPYDRDLWRRKIGLYHKMGNRVEAEAALERLSRIYPNDTVVKHDLSLLSRETWNKRLSATSMAERAANLESWINYEPDNLDYYEELSDLYIRMGDYDRSLNTAKRGLGVFPGNAWLIQRVSNLMSEQGLYTRALMFLKENRVGGTTYQNTMREAATDARLRDPYDIHGRLYAETGDRDALNYLLNTSLTRGYYNDALDFLREAYKLEGRTNDLLLKEYDLQKRMGNEGQAQRLLRELFAKNPNDEGLKEEYIAMQLQLAAIDEEQLDWQGAYEKLTMASKEMPKGSDEWVAAMARRINLLGLMGDELEARRLYGEASVDDPGHRHRFAAAYEDIISKQLKQLIEDEKYVQALSLAQELLGTIYDSEVGLRACINMSQTLKRNDLFYKYAQMGYDYFPEEPYFIIKQAVALQQQGRMAEAMAILTPQKDGDKYPSQQLINPYAGVTEDFALLLLKNKMPDLAIERIDMALKFDPDNSELKYIKGLAYEQLKEYDKAYELQRYNYIPNNADQSEWEEHMRYLRYRSFKNRIDLTYTAAFYDTRNEDLASVGHMYSLASIGYTHMWRKTTLGGGLNYKATDGYLMFGELEKGGTGIEAWLEWGQALRHGWHMTVSGSVGNRYFNKFGGNLEFTASLDKGWSVGGKASYRYTQPVFLYDSKQGWEGDYKSRHLLMLGPRGSKEWERVGLHAALDVIAMDFKHFYYNASLMGKFFVKDDGVTSVSATIGVGSFPELRFFDQTTMNGITNMNAMVGVTGTMLLTKNLIFTINGNWNTYYNPLFNQSGEAMEAYRNIYSVTGALNIVF